MQDFRDLKVWEKGHQLTLAVYRLTTSFPKEELYGLTSQLRRSCSSIPANIAEGCGRNSKGEFAQFLNIAMGSASELEYHLMLARDLQLIQGAKFEHLSTELKDTKRMLAGLIQKVKNPA